MTSIETQLNIALTTVTKQEFEIQALKASLHVKDITIARLRRAEILRASDLPADATERLNAAFAMSVDNHGLREAINVERKVCRVDG
jgi:hypothetical protein